MSNLVCHKTKTHARQEELLYSCGICGKNFSKRSGLRSHEKYGHHIKDYQSFVSCGNNDSQESTSSTAIFTPRLEINPSTVLASDYFKDLIK